jgi:hypothetical protein
MNHCENLLVICFSCPLKLSQDDLEKVEGTFFQRFSSQHDFYLAGGIRLRNKLSNSPWICYTFASRGAVENE